MIDIRKNCQPHLWLLTGTGEGHVFTKSLLKEGWKITVSVVSDRASIPYRKLNLEKILIGALISQNSCIELIENGLSNYHFYVPMLGRIFKAVIELTNKDQIANPLTLDHYFSDDEAFNEIGGKKYLNSLCEGNLGSTIVKDYANLIIELYNKRELIKKIQLGRLETSQDFNILEGKPKYTSIEGLKIKVKPLDKSYIELIVHFPSLDGRYF